jgi:hypothetical protein
MKSLITELRIIFAEWLLGASVIVMPKDASEAEPLTQAIADYFTETERAARWEKFPA